jgi:hypothetical protein
VLLQRLHRPGRRLRAPKRFDELVGRDCLRRAQHEQHEQLSLLHPFEPDALARNLHFERAEQPDVDLRAHESSLRNGSR